MGKIDDLLSALENEGPRGFLRELFGTRSEGGVRFQQGGETVNPTALQRTKKALVVVGTIFVSILFLIMYFFSYIPPNEKGIIKDNWGIFGDAGIQTKVYGTGMIIVLPGQTLLRVPDHPVMLDFANVQSDDEKSEKGVESVYENQKIYHLSRTRIQLSDGFYADNDFTVLVRVADPYQAIVNFGPGDAFVNGGLVPKVDPALKESLGRMTTETYYKWPEIRWILANGSKTDFGKVYGRIRAEVSRSLCPEDSVENEERDDNDQEVKDEKSRECLKDAISSEEKALYESALDILRAGTEKEISAKALLNRDLKEKGLDIVLVAGRYFNFSPEIEQNIEQKVLKVQEAELNKSIEEYNDAQAKLSKVNAEGAQSLNVLRAVGDAYYTQKIGDRDKYVRTKAAAGNKLVGVAEAYKTQKTNAALEIPGAGNWVNKETASALDNIGIMMITPGEYQKMINEWGK